MKQTISVPVYYHIDNDNKIIIDYEQMEEYYKTMVHRLKKETEYTNKNYR